MKRTKQAIGILLSAAMMLAMLAGCGGKPSTSQGGRDNSSGAASGSNSPSRGNVMMTLELVILAVPYIRLARRSHSYGPTAFRV